MTCPIAQLCKADLDLQLRSPTLVKCSFPYHSSLSPCELEKHINAVKVYMFIESSTVFISKQVHSPQFFTLNRVFITPILTFSLSLISTFSIRFNSSCFLVVHKMWVLVILELLSQKYSRMKHQNSYKKQIQSQTQRNLKIQTVAEVLYSQ